MLRNFIWQREDEPQNMLSYVFLFINFFYGVVFTFFSSTSVVTGSAFYEQSIPTFIWGAAVLSLVITTLTCIATRTRWIGEIVGFWGVVVWSYGLFLYLASGLWFAGIAIYLPQVLFWTFWYIGVKRFYYRKDEND